MDRKAQKKSSQQVLNVKNRHGRFITEYILRKHPKLYAEADAFYNKLRSENPNKRDLTKTHEFLVETTSYVDYRDFYCRKKLKVHQKKNQTVTTTTTTTTTRQDTMQLNIELLPDEVVNENTANPLQPVPDSIYQGLLQEIAKDADLQAILDGMTTSNEDEQGIFDDLTTNLEETPLERELHDLC